MRDRIACQGTEGDQEEKGIGPTCGGPRPTSPASGCAMPYPVTGSGAVSNIGHQLSPLVSSLFRRRNKLRANWREAGKITLRDGLCPLAVAETRKAGRQSCFGNRSRRVDEAYNPALRDGFVNHGSWRLTNNPSNWRANCLVR
jgi:hypothetical protein